MRTIYRGCPLYPRFRHSYVSVPSSSAVTLTRLSPLSLSSLLSPVHAAIAGTCHRNLQAAHANVRIPVAVSSRQPQPPRLQDVARTTREKERDRVSRILRKLFTEASYGTTFTRDDSPTFMNVNLILCFRDFSVTRYTLQRIELQILFWE